jgi:hypothetical protein
MSKRSKHRSWVVPKEGDLVVVTWLDSGLGVTSAPQNSDQFFLMTKKTCGFVASCGESPSLSFPAGMDKNTMVLVTCSAGDDDSRAELAYVWVPSIISVENYGSEGPSKAVSKK